MASQAASYAVPTDAIGPDAGRKVNEWNLTERSWLIPPLTINRRELGP